MHNMVEALKMCESQDGVKGIVLIGEIGGAAEEMAAEYIQERITLPVVSFVAWMTAPAGKRMGMPEQSSLGELAWRRTRSRD